jgi:hypothetical protein
MTTANDTTTASPQVTPGDQVEWLEDHSSPESGPEAPVRCFGPVLGLDDGRPVVMAHFDGERLVLEAGRWTRFEGCTSCGGGPDTGPCDCSPCERCGTLLTIGEACGLCAQQAQS